MVVMTLVASTMYLLKALRTADLRSSKIGKYLQRVASLLVVLQSH